MGEDLVLFCGDREEAKSGLYDTTTGAFVNGATVTAALKDSANQAVTGSATTLTYVTGTEGCYEGIMEDVVVLTENATYYLEITATAATDRVAFRRITFKAIYHGVR